MDSCTALAGDQLAADQQLQPHRGLPLLELLEHLPVALLRDSLWPHLPDDARNSCRQASGRLLRLASQLQRRFSFGFSGGDVTPEELQHHCAALARHEHLEVLQFVLPTSELLTATGLRAGGAGCRRVGEVLLAYGSSLAATTGDALALACPALHTLLIENYSGVSPTFFTAVGGLQHLTKVILTETHLSFAAVDGLAALVSLRKLHVLVEEGPPLSPEAVPRLASLTGLRELHLISYYDYTAEGILQLAVVTALTLLTSLQLSVASEGADRDPTCEAAANTVVAQLGVLKGLVDLCISNVFSCIGEVGYVGLRQLTQLTRLHVKSLDALFWPTRVGVLPLLRELRLARPLSSTELLNTLRLLQPLQHLAEIWVEVCLCSSLPEEAQAEALAAAGGDAAAAAASGMAALRQAVTLMDSAALLRKIHVTFVGSPTSVDKVELSDSIAELQVLQPCIRRLALYQCSSTQLEALSAALSRCPVIEALQLHECVMVPATLLDLALHADTLTRLQVMGGCMGDTAVLAMAFAAARVRPLTLSWASLSDAELGTIRAGLKALPKGAVVTLVDHRESA